MKRFIIGLSVIRGMPENLFSETDCIEIKKITMDEASYFRRRVKKPIFFHIQYNTRDEPLLPTAVDFNKSRIAFTGAYDIALPKFVSLHFGLSAEKVRIEEESYLATACSPSLTKNKIVSRISHNLHIARDFFPKSRIFLENMEFIPEELSKGAYRFIQDADFFSENIRGFCDTGILDGMVLDIAHALITSVNHPKYNGLSDIIDKSTFEGIDPIQTDWKYIEILTRHRNDIDILGNFKKYVSLLPFERIKEIHISGIHRLANGVCVDSHRELSRLEISALDTLIDILPVNDEGALPIILEYNRDPDKIPEQIHMLREVCWKKIPAYRKL